MEHTQEAVSKTFLTKKKKWGLSFGRFIIDPGKARPPGVRRFSKKKKKSTDQPVTGPFDLRADS
jgi:hypothetical protein